MNQLRLEARGDINDWLSYRWRQRLNSSNTPHALDNLPSSIDYAMISVRLTDQFVTSIGKQAAAYGGFEYDLDPIEIYQYSDMIDYMLFDFMTGITFSYQVTPTQEIALQVVNSRTASITGNSRKTWKKVVRPSLTRPTGTAISSAINLEPVGHIPCSVWQKDITIIFMPSVTN